MAIKEDTISSISNVQASAYMKLKSPKRQQRLGSHKMTFILTFRKSIVNQELVKSETIN